MRQQLYQLVNSKYRLFILCLNDYVIGIFSLILSTFILFDVTSAFYFLANSFPLLFVIPGVKNSFFYLCNLYSISWRYASLKDIKKTFQTLTFSSIAVFTLSYFLWPLNQRVVIIDFLIYTCLFFSSRFMIRVLRRRSTNQSHQNKKNHVIIGAGDAGEMVARELLKIGHQNHIIGFFDDNPLLHKKTIHQAPVLGAICDLPTICNKKNIDQIIIAIPTASSTEFRRILDVCKSVTIPFLTTPSINELLDDSVNLAKLRDVSIVDLLGRTPINIDTTKIQSIVHGETILITGAGGSIGSELSRQVLFFEPKKVILLDHSEFHLYSIMMELSNLKGIDHIEIIPICLDIKIKASLNNVFQEHRPTIVFHSAAYKHVPLMEINSDQAILNNIGGTKHIVDFCDEFNAKQCITISTDKAVEPSNSMGATKRICELLTLEKAKSSDTKYCCVRFGNVLGSYGSVIPLFKHQIKQGGPITITDPNMTRYFMTIKEAVSLVFQASSLSKTGAELFVLDMGSPIKITQLASDLIRLSGLSNDDIPIVFTGLRPGEKLSEKLFYDFETPSTTEHNKIQCCFPDISGDVVTTVNTILKLAQDSTLNNTLIDELLDCVNELNSTINLASKGAI